MLNLQKCKTILGLSASALILSACMSAGHKPAEVTDAMQANGAQIADNNGDVQTGGLGGQDQGIFLGQDFTVSAPANQKFYFDLDKSDVYKEYMASIKAQAAYLTSHPNARVRLEGNTDERGSREYNVALGERRPDSVAKILKLYGVPTKQIVIVSYGEERPVALGHTESDYKLNRRVDFIYEAKG